MSRVNQELFRNRWVVGITGASGVVYARRTIQLLLEHEPAATVDLVISDAGFRVIREEEDLKLSSASSAEKVCESLEFDPSRVRMHHANDIGATIASGTYLTAGMVIVPCSMATVGAIASGHSQHLVHRAAEVTMKEGRKLILVPRETPLSAIHLENLLKLSRVGVAIVPAMPGYYHQPESLSQLIDMMAMKILDQMGYHLSPVARWKDESAGAGTQIV